METKSYQKKPVAWEGPGLYIWYPSPGEWRKATRDQKDEIETGRNKWAKSVYLNARMVQ